MHRAEAVAYFPDPLPQEHLGTDMLIADIRRRRCFHCRKEGYSRIGRVAVPGTADEVIIMARCDECEGGLVFCPTTLRGVTFGREYAESLDDLQLGFSLLLAREVLKDAVGCEMWEHLERLC